MAPACLQVPSAKQGIVVGAEVAKALREGAPVVALESTIISHGMPYPQNLATAQEVEAIVRQGAHNTDSWAALTTERRRGLL